SRVVRMAAAEDVARHPGVVRFDPAYVDAGCWTGHGGSLRPQRTRIGATPARRSHNKTVTTPGRGARYAPVSPSGTGWRAGTARARRPADRSRAARCRSNPGSRAG